MSNQGDTNIRAIAAVAALESAIDGGLNQKYIAKLRQFILNILRQNPQFLTQEREFNKLQSKLRKKKQLCEDEQQQLQQLICEFKEAFKALGIEAIRTAGSQSWNAIKRHYKRLLKNVGKHAAIEVALKVLRKLVEFLRDFFMTSGGVIPA